MEKDITSTEYWKWRLEQATMEGHLQWSVYLTNDISWGQIEKIHLGIIKHLIVDDDYVLDAGCGYGRMASAFDSEKYVGVDFSEAFIKKARESHPHYSFIIANLKELPFKDKVFDWSFCISIKGMIRANSGETEWQKMLNELKRVSKRVLILEYTNPEDYKIL